MRKTIATVMILGLVWIGYTAWPIYDLLVLVRAMETRDEHTVTQHVYFDAVKVELLREPNHHQRKSNQKEEEARACAVVLRSQRRLSQACPNQMLIRLHLRDRA